MHPHWPTHPTMHDNKTVTVLWFDYTTDLSSSLTLAEILSVGRVVYGVVYCRNLNRWWFLRIYQSWGWCRNDVLWWDSNKILCLLPERKQTKTKYCLRLLPSIRANISPSCATCLRLSGPLITRRANLNTGQRLEREEPVATEGAWVSGAQGSPTKMHFPALLNRKLHLRLQMR